MKITNEALLEFTADMPMKVIPIDGEPYLERYFLGTTKDDKDLWIHRFLSPDGERHLHSHPFFFKTAMLLGWYDEETPEGVETVSADNFPIPGMGPLTTIKRTHASVPSFSLLFPDSLRRVSVFDWHRISSVGPRTWTLMIVDPERLPFWCFREEDGRHRVVPSSPRGWWRDYGPREEVAA